MVSFEDTWSIFFPVSITLLAIVILITIYNAYSSITSKSTAEHSPAENIIDSPVYTITVEDDPPPKYSN